MKERIKSIFRGTQKTLFAFLSVLVGGILIGLLMSAPSASANFLQDLFGGFFSPFTSRIPTSTVGTVTDILSAPSAPAAPYAPTIDYEQAVIGAVKKASPAVVSIVISKDVPVLENCPQSPFFNLPPEFQQFFGDQLPNSGQCTQSTQRQDVGGGSGFIVTANGLIVTNKHVVSDTKASYTVFTNDGKKYDAKVLARDPVQDLAIIKIDAANLPTLELGDSDSVELGQTAIAIGNALGEYRNTVSVGVVSGLSRTVTASGGNVGTETIQGVIQTDAAINPGNSGGPLLNLKGQVIAINTAIASNAQNIGFAIPINRAKKDIQSVKTSGEIVTPYLGVRYILVTPDVAKAQKLPVDYGALVRGSNDGSAVAANSPAAQAGVQAEDIILNVSGKKIDGDHALADVINSFGVGDVVTLNIQRGATQVSLRATLAKRPQ